MGRPISALLAASLLGPARALLSSASVAHRAGDWNKCECFSWWDVYNVFGVHCGQGHEFDPLTRRGVPWATAGMLLGDQVCNRLYQRFPDENNFCTNVDYVNAPTQWYGGQWCYVSAYCKEKNGGSNITSGVGWKMCERGKDPTLREKPLEELLTLAKKFGIDAGHLAKLAYPVVGAAKGANNTMSLRQLRPGAEDDLGTTSTSTGEPVVLDSVSGQPPYQIVAGSRTYEVRLTKDVEVQWKASNWGQITELVCVRGCEK